ncbi:lipopolysaccharide biosynthesis protein [Rubritalea sp.]|uniref:lipopolysaccharide biosynthesis protein n=1 Tax=Rubritalea sp. TaxID=2109375 RepID=UPI003EF2C08B
MSNQLKDSSVDFKDLKKKSIRGGAVTLVAQAVQISIQLVSTVVLARLLGPEEFGVIAMVMAVAAFAQVFGDLGLSTAAIQKKDLTDAQQSNLFWINVLVGTGLTCVVAASAPLVANFYDRPELLWVTVAISLSFLIASLGAQHGARLTRDMLFAKKSTASIAGALVTLIASIVLAYKGYSYWSLVWGRLAGGVVTMLALWAFSPFMPSLPHRGSGVRELVGFGANVTAFDFVNYFSRNLDNILIGRVWGAVELGFYSRAYQLLMVPVMTLRAPIQAVAFPAMSKLDSKGPDFREYYKKSTEILAWLTIPTVGFLYFHAEAVISLLLGEEWLASVPIFKAFAIVGMIQPVASLRGIILLSSGQPRRYLYAGIISSVVVCLAFLYGVQTGVEYLAQCYAAAVVLSFYPMYLYAIKNTSLLKLDILRACIWPIIALFFSSVLYKLPIYVKSQPLAQYGVLMLLSIGAVFLTNKKLKDAKIKNFF